MASQPDLREQLEQSLAEEDQPETEQPENDNEGEQDEGEELDDHPDDGEVITFGDAETQTEDEPEGMRNLRNRLKERERELKEIQGRKVEEELGPRPTIEAFDYNDEEHTEALEKWIAKRDAIKRRETEEAERGRKLQERFDGQRRDYETAFTRLNVTGKEAARARAEDSLNEAQHMMVIKAGREKAPALMVLLGSDRSKLDELLNHADDPADFLIHAALMAEKINVQKRKPTTQPEERHGGSPGGGAGRGDAKLTRLEEEANRTGDRSKLIAYRQHIKN